MRICLLILGVGVLCYVSLARTSFTSCAICDHIIRLSFVRVYGLHVDNAHKYSGQLYMCMPVYLITLEEMSLNNVLFYIRHRLPLRIIIMKSEKDIEDVRHKPNKIFEHIIVSVDLSQHSTNYRS